MSVDTLALFSEQPALGFIAFTVFGHPQPQGSSRAFTPKGWSRPIITSANSKLKPWRQQITETAMTLGLPMLDCAVRLDLDFYFAKPKSAKKRTHHTTRPDRDKLLRAVCDALTGVLYKDDSQIVAGETNKHYGSPERVEIRLVRI